MRSREKFILSWAGLVLLLVGGSYAIRFYGSPISGAASDWAALGDYFGGILGPIFSFILIILVILESVESRRNFLDARQLQLQSQEQINRQIELLTPRPDMIYYPIAIGKSVHAVIENIGTATAYTLRVDFTFDHQPTPYLLERVKSMSNPIYIPPKYKLSVLAGQLLIDNTVFNLPPHSVTIRYSDTPDGLPANEKTYVVDTQMLKSLHSHADYSDVLGRIADELKGGRK